MKRLAAAGLALALLLAGCARHFVAPREAGRVDGARSISSYSDLKWTIVREPGPGEGVPTPAPAETTGPALAPAR
jgi:hypothetical protein